MTIEAKVILDSRAPNGARLTTFELTYPRFIHAELMTHRVFSRNAASSRAIPTPKKIERIRKDCAKPSEWGINQKGMVASGSLNEADAEFADYIWSQAMCDALRAAELLCGIRCASCGKTIDQKLPTFCGGQEGSSHHRLDLHKQVANRILEPFDHITTVVSTTKLSNHWKLRLEVDPVTGRPMPDPTYFELATKWKAAFDASVPRPIGIGEWHLPYVDLSVDAEAAGAYLRSIDDDLSYGAVISLLKKVSVGRIARTSYMRQGQGDIAENVKLHDGLAKNGHWSPFEPVATPMGGFEFALFGGHHRMCDWCVEDQPEGAKAVKRKVPYEGHDRGLEREMLCQKCALGHVTSGNFVGWHQYRKDFANEAGGD